MRVKRIAWMESAYSVRIQCRYKEISFARYSFFELSIYGEDYNKQHTRFVGLLCVPFFIFHFFHSRCLCLCFIRCRCTAKIQAGAKITEDAHWKRERDTKQQQQRKQRKTKNWVAFEIQWEQDRRNEIRNNEKRKKSASICCTNTIG